MWEVRPAPVTDGRPARRDFEIINRERSKKLADRIIVSLPWDGRLPEGPQISSAVWKCFARWRAMSACTDPIIAERNTGKSPTAMAKDESDSIALASRVYSGCANGRSLWSTNDKSPCDAMAPISSLPFCQEMKLSSAPRTPGLYGIFVASFAGRLPSTPRFRLTTGRRRRCSIPRSQRANGPEITAPHEWKKLMVRPQR